MTAAALNRFAADEPGRPRRACFIPFLFDLSFKVKDIEDGGSLGLARRARGTLQQGAHDGRGAEPFLG